MKLNYYKKTTQGSENQNQNSLPNINNDESQNGKKSLKNKNLKESNIEFRRVSTKLPLEKISRTNYLDKNEFLRQ
jgi:hypothetical protein